MRVIDAAYCQSFRVDTVLDHADAHTQLVAIESCILRRISYTAILRLTLFTLRILVLFEAEELTSRVLIS